MHELALAEGIVSAILELAHKRKGRVIGFKVAVGELSQFDKRLIEELLIKLVEGTELKDASIVVEVENALIKCLYCGSKWGFDDLVEPLSKHEKEMVHFLPELLNSFSKCPSCEKSDLEIERGRSVRLVEVELDV